MKNGSKWMLTVLFCLVASIAPAQCGPDGNCSPHDEDSGGGGSTINCPNPEDYAPGCRSINVMAVKFQPIADISPTIPAPPTPFRFQDDPPEGYQGQGWYTPQQQWADIIAATLVVYCWLFC